MGITKKRIKEIEAIRDDDIDFTDIPETDDALWERAELRMPKPKTSGPQTRFQPREGPRQNR